MRKFFYVLLLLFAGSAWALDDSPKTRAMQADRYLKAAPPREMFENMAEKMARNLPPKKRTAFKNMMTKHLDINALTKAMRGAMIKNFTADELRALADFYGSPVGRSAMRKFGDYLADVAPSIQTEMIKAREKINRELDGKRQ